MNLACGYIRLLLEIHREVDESIDQSTNKVDNQRKIIHSTSLLQVESSTLSTTSEQMNPSTNQSMNLPIKQTHVTS